MEEGIPWSEGPRTISVRPWGKRWVSYWGGGLPTPDGIPWDEPTCPVTDYEVAGMLARVLNARTGMRHGGSTHRKAHYQEIVSDGSWHYYYIRPGQIPDGVYVDIRHAYHSIYSMIPSWDVRYMPGRYLLLGHVPFPFDSLQWLDARRSARNGIVGIAGSTRAPIYLPDGTTQWRRVYGVSNYQWSLLILRVLQHAMFDAHRASRDDCMYINTDGLIVRERSVEAVVNVIRDRWGLDCSIKGRGYTDIRDVGAYRIGDDVSGHWARCKVRSGTWYVHAHGLEEEHGWMLKRWWELAERRENDGCAEDGRVPEAELASEEA